MHQTPGATNLLNANYLLYTAELISTKHYEIYRNVSEKKKGIIFNSLLN